MIINYIYYLPTIFKLLLIQPLSIPDTYSSEIVMPEQVIDFNLDLAFIYKTLHENHPGACNALDDGFLNEMEKNFTITKQKLLTADLVEKKIEIIEELGRSFNDAHLWIHYNLNNTNISSKSKKVRSFTIQEIKQGFYWIQIPSFHPSREEIDYLNSIIQSLYQLRDKTIIFDLRGNGGGNSSWGLKILQSLFGKEYVDEQLAAFQRNVYAEWRVSQGNLEHVKELILIITNQFGEYDPTTVWIKNIYNGMANALLSKKNYYSEPLSITQSVQSFHTTNVFNGHIIAIIDKHCGSACLDFLDDLKALNPNVTFIGESTGADSVYMELREVSLPSGKGSLGFPIKVFRNRLRGHNEPHIPDIVYKGNLQDTIELQNSIINFN